MPDPVIDSESILEVIQTAADGPQEVSSDAGTVRQFALTDLIAVHKYLASIPPAGDTGTRRKSGLVFARLIPGGTVQRDTPPCRRS